MYELVYLYEQLKTQTIQEMYINKLNTLTESAYDIISTSKNINETMELIEEVSKTGKLNFFDKLKTNMANAEKILSKNREAALKCKPIGLIYKDFVTTVSEAEIKKKYQLALNYLNKFNEKSASEEQLKTFILDSKNNVQYLEISRIFGNGKERFTLNDIVVVKKHDKELSKNDISDAVKFLQNYDSVITRLQKDFADTNNQYTNYVRNNSGLATNNTSGDIEKIRKNALNHKMSLINIVDSTYYQMMSIKLSYDFNQAKRIVVKAANYNPRNLKESAKIQDYIDATYDFYENC